MCKASPDRIARERFAMIEKNRRDEISRLHNAKEEGRKIGRTEAKIGVVQRLLENGVSMELTSEITSISVKKIKRRRIISPITPDDYLLAKYQSELASLDEF